MKIKFLKTLLLIWTNEAFREQRVISRLVTGDDFGSSDSLDTPIRNGSGWHRGSYFLSAAFCMILTRSLRYMQNTQSHQITKSRFMVWPIFLSNLLEEMDNFVVFFWTIIKITTNF